MAATISGLTVLVAGCAQVAFRPDFIAIPGTRDGEEPRTGIRFSVLAQQV